VCKQVCLFSLASSSSPFPFLRGIVTKLWLVPIFQTVQKVELLPVHSIYHLLLSKQIWIEMVFQNLWWRQLKAHSVILSRHPWTEKKIIIFSVLQISRKVLLILLLLNVSWKILFKIFLKQKKLLVSSVTPTVFKKCSRKTFLRFHSNRQCNRLNSVVFWNKSHEIRLIYKYMNIVLYAIIQSSLNE